MGSNIKRVRHSFVACAWCAPLLLIGACSQEARDIGPAVPQTAPNGAADPRIPYYQGNLYQLSQGGRYFAWYGCAGCHAEGAPGGRNLADGQWRRGSTFDRVYGAIATGHGALRYGERIAPEQLWQITAYVRDLPLHTPEKRRRLSVDQVNEPQGRSWAGPVR